MKLNSGRKWCGISDGLIGFSERIRENMSIWSQECTGLKLPGRNFDVRFRMTLLLGLFG
jgi:hypothetical protein